MHDEQKIAEAGLRALCEALGLPYEPQDWGIVNADPARLEEFMSYLLGSTLTATQKYEMAELILSSANERLVGGGSLDFEDLIRVIRREPAAFATPLAYWRGIADGTEFPLWIQLEHWLMARE